MMRNSNEREEIKWIFTEFNRAKSRGLFVMINGTYCNSQEEVDHLLLIREEESYMEDYMKTIMTETEKALSALQILQRA